ncbi:MAG: hypothetical protein K2X81_12010 [Candidatus Obscuribacterales bacterium]|nr:hypothetical protein [Candidatus Obscuribacterales bacterium]
MPENDIELNAAKKGQPAVDTTGDAFRREVELLHDGIKQGVMHRLSSPGDLAVSAGVAFVGAAGLRLAMDAGGKWGTAAKIAGAGFLALGASDLARRAVPTTDAMIDTWKSGRNLDVNKLTVANNLGTAVVDYPLMALAGSAGFKMASRSTAVSVDLGGPKLADASKSARSPFDNPEMLRSMLLHQEAIAIDLHNHAAGSRLTEPRAFGGDMMPPTTKALIESGTPIRTAGPAGDMMPPATKALIENGIPINPETRASWAAFEKQLLEIKHSGADAIPPDVWSRPNEGWSAETLKNVKAMEMMSEIKPPDLGAKLNPPGNAFSKNFPEITLPKYDPASMLNQHSTFQYADIRVARVFPSFPVLPVDLMNKLE